MKVFFSIIAVFFALSDFGRASVLPAPKTIDPSPIRYSLVCPSGYFLAMDSMSLKTICIPAHSIHCLDSFDLVGCSSCQDGSQVQKGVTVRGSIGSTAYSVTTNVCPIPYLLNMVLGAVGVLVILIICIIVCCCCCCKKKQIGFTNQYAAQP